MTACSSSIIRRTSSFFPNILIFPVQTSTPSVTLHFCLDEGTCPFLVSCHLPIFTSRRQQQQQQQRSCLSQPTLFSIEPRLTDIRSFIQTRHCHSHCHCRHQIGNLDRSYANRATAFLSNDSTLNLSWWQASTFSLTPSTICPSLLQAIIEALFGAGHCQPTTFYCITSKNFINPSPMPRLKALVPILALFLLSLFIQTTYAAPKPEVAATPATAASSSYWLANINRNGAVAFAGAQTPSYLVYRDVSKYGAKGKSRPPALH